MSQRKTPPAARLLFSVIYRDDGDFEKAVRTIDGRIARIEYASGPFPFDRSDYYEREMGARNNFV